MWLNISRGGSRGHHVYQGENPPTEALINFFVKDVPADGAFLEISDVSGELFRTAKLEVQPGINQYEWNMQFDPSRRQKQQYIAQQRDTFDQMVEMSGADRRQRQAAERILQGMNENMTADELQAASRELQQALGGGGVGGMGGGRGGRGGGLRGENAGAGTYRVTLTVGNQVMTATITLKADPLLSEK